jgi:hypothetical protein
VGRRSDIDWEKVQRLYVAGHALKAIAADFGIAYSTLVSHARPWRSMTDDGKRRLRLRELRLGVTDGNKLCSRCETIKPKSLFDKNPARKDGCSVYCSECVDAYAKQQQYESKRWANNKDKERQRHRNFIASNKEVQLERYRKNAKAYRLSNPGRVNATNLARSKHRFVPSFADKKAISTIYEKAREWGEILGVQMQVDHIVPLRGKIVCGLHCEANLQLLEKSLNHSKRNFTWPDMP